MPIDQLALLFAVVIAANLLVLLALQLPWRGRRTRSEFDRQPQGGPTGDGQGAGTRRLLNGAGALPTVVYQRVVRVASLVFIVAAVVVVALTGVGTVTPVIVFLALGAMVVVLFQDVLPAGSLGRWRLPLEAAVTIVFLTVLLILTGGHTSPFFFGYILLLGAGSVLASGLGPPVLAIATSAAYLIGVLVPYSAAPASAEDIGRIAFNLVALALVSYVSAIVGRELRRAGEEALRDPLTGLSSRTSVIAEIEQEILRAGRSGRPFALLMFDLDGLKAANDHFGHAAGDQLLRGVAETVVGSIRGSDTAARYGGDEFVLLLPETDLAGGQQVAEKVRADVGRLAIPSDGSVIRTTISIGLVSYPEDGRTSKELIDRADQAMLEAKRRGRDQVVRFARKPRPLPDASPPPERQPPEEPPAAAPQSARRRPPAGPLPPAAAAVEWPTRVDFPPQSPGPAPWESSGS